MSHDERILEILKSLSTNVATILKEQQSQRIDIRSLQRDVSNMQEIMATKNDLAGSEARLKVDIKDLSTEVVNALKTHEERLRDIEVRLGITDPTKH